MGLYNGWKLSGFQSLFKNQIKKMNYSEAKKHAELIVEALAPHCHRIEVGGSIRRKKKFVKDIEIILSPKMSTPKRRSSKWANAIFNLGRIMKGASRQTPLNVSKYIEIDFLGSPVDIFITTPEQFGMTYLIRTGSKDFSKRIFEKFKKLGFISIDGVHTHKETGKKIKFKTELEIFAFLNIPFVKPENRN